MPQMTKGGKYIFGWSEIGENGELIFPIMAVEEYKLKKKIISISFQEVNKQEDFVY